ERAAHLLHEQERIGADENVGGSLPPGPFERGNQPAIFRDVVRRDADRLAELFDERSIRPLDPDAVAGRARIAAGAAVDVGDDGTGDGHAPLLRGLSDAVGRRGGGRGDEIEDPLATVALDYAVVPADVVED